MSRYVSVVASTESDLLAVQSIELGRDDLEEVLEHVGLLRCLQSKSASSLCRNSSQKTNPQFRLVKRVCINANSGLQLATARRLREVVFVITLESKFVDGMREVVPVAIFFEIRHELVQVGRVRAEGATGGQMDISDDLVDAEPSSDVATLAGLVLEFVGPTFVFALRDRDSKRQRPIAHAYVDSDGRTCSIASGLLKLQPRFTYACRTSSHV